MINTVTEQENIFGTVIKFILRLFPSSLPRALYNRLILFKPLKKYLDLLITSILPPSVSLPEGELIINRADPALSSMLFFGVFEPFFSEVFRENIHPGMNIIDIGANIGYYTLIAAKLCGPEGRVIAYEPDASNISFLEKNIAQNGLSNVTVVAKALSDTDGPVRFYISDDNLCTHGLIDNRSSKKFVEVQAERLDESLATLAISKIDLIKMDIEGAEVLALEGMEKTIRDNPHLIIMTEFYPKAIRRLGRDPLHFLTAFADMGFSLSVIDEKQKRLVPLPSASFTQFISNFSSGEATENLYAKKKIV